MSKQEDRERVMKALSYPDPRQAMTPEPLTSGSRSENRFAQWLAVIEALPRPVHHEEPVRDHCPGMWPTVGDLRRLVQQLATLQQAAQEAGKALDYLIRDNDASFGGIADYAAVWDEAKTALAALRQAGVR